MNQDQIKLVKKLNDLKRKIQLSDDREMIVLYIKEVIKLSECVNPRTIEKNDGTIYSYEQGKIAALNFLKYDILNLEEDFVSNFDILRRGVVISIVKLMLTYTEQGISQLEEIVESNN